MYKQGLITACYNKRELRVRVGPGSNIQTTFWLLGPGIKLWMKSETFQWTLLSNFDNFQVRWPGACDYLWSVVCSHVDIVRPCHNWFGGWESNCFTVSFNCYDVFRCWSLSVKGRNITYMAYLYFFYLVLPYFALYWFCNSRRLTSPHLTSPHLTSPLLTSPHLTSPHLTSPHLTSPHLTSSHLISSHLISSHLISLETLSKRSFLFRKRWLPSRTVATASHAS